MGGYVYIMTNKWNEVFYVGVTSNLSVRVKQHILKLNPNSFTARYNLYKLVLLCMVPYNCGGYSGREKN